MYSGERQPKVSQNAYYYSGHCCLKTMKQVHQVTCDQSNARGIKCILFPDIDLGWKSMPRITLPQSHDGIGHLPPKVKRMTHQGVCNSMTPGSTDARQASPRRHRRHQLDRVVLPRTRLPKHSGGRQTAPLKPGRHWETNAQVAAIVQQQDQLEETLNNFTSRFEAFSFQMAMLSRKATEMG